MGAARRNPPLFGNTGETLRPPPNVDSDHPADMEVRCEQTDAVFTHPFRDNQPATVVMDNLKAGQTQLITSTRGYYPPIQGHWQALKLYGVQAIK